METKLQGILELHLKWLNNEKGGQRADLQCADLRGADLQCADLQCADLRGANLQGADLQGADMDYTVFQLSCNSKGMKVSMNLIYQLLAHVCALSCEDDEYQTIKTTIMPYALKSHRAVDLGLKEESN